MDAAPFAMVVPPAPLSAVLRCVWFAHGAEEPGSRERVLPNGVIEVIISMDDAEHGVVVGDRVDPFRHSFVAGMQRGPLMLQTAPFTNLVGLRFRPGGLPALWRLPMHELSDGVFELPGFDGSPLGGLGLLRLRDRLMHTSGIAARMAVIQAALTPAIDIDDRAIGRVRAAVAVMLAEPGVGVRDLAARLGVTHQHLLRQFRDRVGVAPRTLGRILRFNRVIEAIGPATTAPRWADVAAATGYYDQPHLVAEFRALAGVTPGAYWALKLADGNHVRVPGTFSSSNTEESVPA